jgi:hypothetical protein
LDYYPFLARDMEYVKNQTKILKANDFFTSVKIHEWLFRSCAYHFDQALESIDTKNPADQEYYRLGAVTMLGMVNRIYDSYKGGFYAIPNRWQIDIAEGELVVTSFNDEPYGFYKSALLVNHVEKQRKEFTHGLFLSLKEYGADRIDGKPVDPDYRYVFAV